MVAGRKEDGALGRQVVGEAAAHLGGHAHPRREEGGEDVVVRLGEGDGLPCLPYSTHYFLLHAMRKLVGNIRTGIGDVVDEALVAVLKDEVGASVPGVGEILC